MKNIKIEIDKCEEEILLAEEGIKETKKFLTLSPDDDEDEELLKTLHFYKEELQYQSDRLEYLLITDWEKYYGKRNHNKSELPTFK